jgi:hypothetical protein
LNALGQGNKACTRAYKDETKRHLHSIPLQFDGEYARR